MPASLKNTVGSGYHWLTSSAQCLLDSPGVLQHHALCWSEDHEVVRSQAGNDCTEA